jgi:hypothetical protein
VVTGTLNGCGGLACHSRPPLASGLDLRPTQAFDALVNAPSTVHPGETRVVPGDPARSFAWRKLTDALGPDDGKAMPSGLLSWHPINDDALWMFRCWIEQGATR